MADTDVRELLAAYAHEAWAGWMRHMFGLSRPLGNGAMVIPANLVKRWTRQMDTPYAELPENEKPSDRKEADRMLAIVAGEPTDHA